MPSAADRCRPSSSSPATQLARWPAPALSRASRAPVATCRPADPAPPRSAAVRRATAIASRPSRGGLTGIRQPGIARCAAAVIAASRRDDSASPGAPSSSVPDTRTPPSYTLIATFGRLEVDRAPRPARIRPVRAAVALGRDDRKPHPERRRAAAPCRRLRPAPRSACRERPAWRFAPAIVRRSAGQRRHRLALPDLHAASLERPLEPGGQRLGPHPAVAVGDQSADDTVAERRLSAEHRLGCRQPAGRVTRPPE